ncbi:MAG: helix-turn-helix transcriptional regulator [Dysgonamonadaceae bacterium]|nr:helix-turn-helix transcriptional regulator [Dysgonamonadaceae bacterium]
MALIIKDVLKQKGITIKEFADMLNINRVNLSAQINGNPTLETLEKWCDALHVDISDLFEKTTTTVNCPNCGTTINIKVS